jgi:hypothetical protein|tara:strand:+ start:266 stop:466 length:201 start_codon:yes stop_codon:yes gene_type:complete
MRNRNLIYKKINSLESTLTNLKRIVNTQEPIESYKINLNKAQELVEDVRGLIESQPMDPSEINPIR